MAGLIDRWFLDQSGFAPTLPTGFRWGRLGTRLVVPYEAPQGRRVTGVGALAPDAPGGPRLLVETRRKREGRYDAIAHLAFIHQIATGSRADRRPCIVVRDNDSVHHRQVVKAALPALTTANMHVWYLPPYRPERNAIAPVWRQITYQDLPVRSHSTDHALQAAVETALRDRATRLRESPHDVPRPA